MPVKGQQSPDSQLTHIILYYRLLCKVRGVGIIYIALFLLPGILPCKTGSLTILQDLYSNQQHRLLYPVLLSSSSVDQEAFYCETQSVTFSVKIELNGFAFNVDFVTLAG